MKKPQVFISFPGKDERKKLLPHLKHHLEASPSNVRVFTDDDITAQQLDRLYNHIRNSWLVIVIFSVSYLESSWCLNELVEIKKCLQTEKIKFVMPIFYKVEAYEVKEQKGEFGAKFQTLEKSCPDKVKKWKKALGFVANYVGLTYQEQRYYLSQP